MTAPRIKPARDPIQEFENFGGDPAFLTALRTSPFASPDSTWNLMLRQQSSLRPRRDLKHLRKAFQNAQQARYELEQLPEGMRGNRVEPLELLEKTLQSQEELTRRNFGEDYLGRGAHVRDFMDYFWLAALVPYTHFVSGQPRWAWIRRYLNDMMPPDASGKERFERIQLSWKKMCQAAKRANEVIQRTQRFKPNPDGLTRRTESLAPNYPTYIIESMMWGAASYFMWSRTKDGMPPAWKFKLGKPESKYIAVVKKHMPFLRGRIPGAYEKPPTLTRRQKAALAKINSPAAIRARLEMKKSPPKPALSISP